MGDSDWLGGLYFVKDDEISVFSSLFPHSGLQAALDEAPHTSDGPSIGLVFPPVDEGDETGRVQGALGSGTRLQPRLLQAESS